MVIVVYNPFIFLRFDPLKISRSPSLGQVTLAPVMGAFLLPLINDLEDRLA